MKTLARAVLAHAGVLLSLFAAAPRARAEPSAEVRVAAAALFEDGRRLLAERRYAEACPKLEESQRMDPGMGTLYNLALCYEATNRTASAWVSFRDVAAAARAAGQLDREKVARSKASALEPQLAKLEISVPRGAATVGVEVTRDGTPVSRALWGTAVPVDPGSYVIRASAAGKTPWQTTVHLEQPGAVVVVEVPALAEQNVSETPDSLTPRAAPVDGEATGTGEATRTTSHRWERPTGTAAVGLGAVGMGVATGLGFIAKGKFNQSAPDCPSSDRCTPDGASLRNDAVGIGNLGTAVFVGGAVVAAAGVVLWIAAPPSSLESSASHRLIPPELGIGPAAIALRGSF
jgi:serine/threonine-protein kinase